MATVQQLLNSGADLPTDSPRRDSEVLLGHCLGKSRTWLYAWPEAEVADQAAAHFTTLLERRRAGEPVAYLTGQREFWSLTLAVNEATLIPRPETELLVIWALELELPANAAVLDLGTGSGAIALALASERPQWHLTGVDASDAALTVARANAQLVDLSQVTFSRSNWFEALAGTTYDLLVANPPYIDSADPHLAEGDVRFEPRAALVAADEGLADLAHIGRAGTAHLTRGGWLLLEHGYQQGAALRELLVDAGYADVSSRRDLAGRERVTGGYWHAQ